MKKLLGLVALAPLSLAACGGLDSYQTIVKEVAEATIAKGDIESCEHYALSSDVTDCKDVFEVYENIYENGGEASLKYSDWKTYEETEDGVVQVDVTIELSATGSGVTIELTTNLEYFLSDHDGTWMIDSVNEEIVTE